MSELLNYKIQGNGLSVILLHGLFGDLNNLGTIAKELAKDHQVISLDLRNHGQSFHSDVHHYEAMAKDVDRLMEHLAIDSAIVIGHSMGGKVAMRLAIDRPQRVCKAIIIDIAPTDYGQPHHMAFFATLEKVRGKKISERTLALNTLANDIKEKNLQNFFAKSLYKTSEGFFDWRFNVKSLHHNARDIANWYPMPCCPVPILFIKGQLSDYISAQNYTSITHQFSNSKAHVIANAGHWVHAEKPKNVIAAIRKFID